MNDFKFGGDTPLGAMERKCATFKIGFDVDRANRDRQYYELIQDCIAVAAAPHRQPKPVELDLVNHPLHYGGENNPLEVIKIIEAYELNFNVGNCIKYVLRVGKKDPATRMQDLQKARWYLEREIGKMK